jgi:hypothetical protein
VSLIKASNENKIQTDKKKIAFLSRLRRLDRPKDYISPLLSIIEGELGREDSAAEKSACQRKESEAIRNFYKWATTDSDYLDQSSKMIGDVFTEYREGGWPAREKYLQEASHLIAKGVKKDKRKAIEEQLIALSLRVGLKPSDPLVVLFMACLHGSEEARKVIKPNALCVYNVLNDLHVLSRMGSIQSSANSNRALLRIRFVSMDEGLVGVLSKIEIVECKMSVDGELQMVIKFLPELFTELSEEERIDLLNRLVKLDG